METAPIGDYGSIRCCRGKPRSLELPERNRTFVFNNQAAADPLGHRCVSVFWIHVCTLC